MGASVTSRVSPGATQPVSIPTTEPGSTTATEPGDTTAALSATPTDHINAAATELVTRPTGAHGHAPISIGIDSWGVDYGLLDPSGRLMGSPIHYRDTRTDGLLELTRSIIDDQSLYEVSGLQFLPINTIYQLQAEADRLPQARHMLMIPDLIAYWLTGQTGAEVTNASTTGLLDVRTREWSQPLLAQLGLPPELFPELRHPGDHIGTLLPEVAEETGLPMETSVIAVASHDTASAVAAIPASGPGFGFLSCGTWSLAGVELQAPVITAASRTANFTNEAGLDGTVRYLRNVMGLWILQECLRLWGSPALDELLAAASELPKLRSVVDTNAPEFLRPGDMPARIAEHCLRTGQPIPGTPAETIRCIVDSLALAHRDALHTAAELSGTDLTVIHLVGGGSRNALLCQATADACGLPVIAGPVEATALGNALVQARAAGLVKGLAEMRALVAATQPLQRYEPQGGPSLWQEAATRLHPQP
ncbi:rhamnulokinase [Nonomuraea sp. NBC_01738]|uniref:rhamnulokinase n=1 Tax=Nonomuraea sp. NBC_01738 TaxID=2976003 RepID=UPI002E1528EA|nr:rhamnulokinase [Nonomuraea sp. NBC_01738]